MMIINFVQMANYKLNSKDKITYTIYSTELAFPTLLHTPYGEIKITYKHEYSNVPSTTSTRQTSAHDNNIDSAIKFLRAVPGTQLNSQLNSAVTRPVQNRRTPRQRNTTLTQSDYNTLNGTH